MQIKINLKIFIFILIFFITGQVELYGILMLFAFIHELGHMICGILLGFKPKELKIAPMGVSISFQVSAKDYNRSIKNANLLTFKKLWIAVARTFYKSSDNRDLQYISNLYSRSFKRISSIYKSLNLYF